jgi:hypothetical protein
MVRAFLITILFASIIPLHAQVALSAEGLIAYPVYSKKEKTGITTDHLQPGFRLGGYYYIDYDAPSSFMISARFTHQFPVTDSAIVEAFDQNYGAISLYGSAKSVFSSFIPQLGGMFKSQKFPLLGCRWVFGIGASWGNTLYTFPDYDSLTMTYYNPPWSEDGRRNEERKVVSFGTCFAFNLAIQYEFHYFSVFCDLDYSKSSIRSLSSPISLGAGILVPVYKGKGHSTLLDQ